MAIYGGVSQEVELFPSAARTASVNGETKSIGAGKRTVTAYLDVTAVSGTSPTLDVKLQDSTDNGNTWTDVDGGAFAQFTAVGQAHITVLIRRAANAIRAVATIGGTSPSFTFKVEAVARS